MIWYEFSEFSGSSAIKHRMNDDDAEPSAMQWRNALFLFASDFELISFSLVAHNLWRLRPLSLFH